MAHEEALRIIAAARGSHFDPDITDAMLSIADDFAEIAMTYGDDR